MDLMSAIIIISTGALVAGSCSILGCFLVLRQQSMLGDAISRAILPGIVLAFWISNSMGGLVMFLGAVVVGILTTYIVQLLSSGGVHEDAAMGVTFTALFALGVVGVSTVGEGVHLDRDCVLYGEIAYAPFDTLLFGGQSWGPKSLWTNGALFLLNLGVISLFYKQFKLCTFDPELAAAVGIPVMFFHYLLMSMVALTVVGAFENVGVILVVAMIVAPAAAAYLMTDALGWMITYSIINGIIASFSGYLVAALTDCSIAGAMGSMAGIIFFVAFLISPRHGLLSRWWARLQLRRQVIEEDILLWAGRRLELDVANGFATRDVNYTDSVATQHSGPALKRLVNQGYLTIRDSAYELTGKGREEFENLIKRHRLYETYLDELGYPLDHLHDAADRVEHVITKRIAEKIDEEVHHPSEDPQGKQIPRS